MGEVVGRRLPFGLDNYIKSFSGGTEPRDPNNARIAMDYYRNVQGANAVAVARFAQLEGDQNRIDTALEWLYASYYHVAVRDIRPPEADAILPANNPKLADQKLGAVAFQEIQILRFLGDTAALGRHEGVLKFITDRGNVTRAEVETFYRNGIRGLISDIVDEEFNKVEFRIARHNAALTRNPQNGQYILSYGGVNTNGEIRTVTGNSLEALSHEMRNGNNKNDFTPADLNTVRAQAELMPAVRLGRQSVDDIKVILVNFYTTPNTGTYNSVRDVYVLFNSMWIDTGGQPIFRAANDSYGKVLYELSDALGAKVIVDSRGQSAVISLSREQQQRLVGLR